MATAIDWPAQVLVAAAVKFKTRVSAFLWLPEVEYPCLTGRVFMDLSQRFREGRLIRTSGIISLSEEHGYSIAHTFSGSSYLLISQGVNPFAGLSRLPPADANVTRSVH